MQLASFLLIYGPLHSFNYGLASPLGRREAGPLISDNNFTSVSSIEPLILPITPDNPSLETIVISIKEGSSYVYQTFQKISQDFGATWNDISVKNELKGSKYNPNKLFGGDFKSLYVSYDRGMSFESIELPKAMRESFDSHYFIEHPFNLNYMIVNRNLCDKHHNDCPYVSHISKDGGRTFQKLKEKATCEFVSNERQQFPPDLIYCRSRENYRGPQKAHEFFYSTEFFTEKSPKHLLDGKKLKDVTQYGSFVIATIEEHENYSLAISRDGVNFHHAHYPSTIPGASEDDMIVLDSSDSLLIFEPSDFDEYYGTLLHTGKDGYEFSAILQNVCRDKGKEKTVDYRKLKSVEGVLVANILSNVDDFKSKGALPIVQTVISHSNGAKWETLRGPSGKDLHFPQISDVDSFSRDDMSGIYINTGYEGEIINNRHTYMTRDAGISWEKIHDNEMHSAISDYGAVIVLISSGDDVDTFLYSFDEGRTWKHHLLGFKGKVVSLKTSPNGDNRNFLIISKVTVEDKSDFHLLNLNFDTADLATCSNSDFYTWSPEHPQTNSKCLLGKEIEYMRRKSGSNCNVAPHFRDSNDENTGTVPPYKFIKNCTCTKDDYEPDFYHFFNTTSNALEQTEKIPTQEEQCANDAISWKRYPGYRKIAASSCEGEFMEAEKRFACPGKEKEFSAGEDLSDKDLRSSKISAETICLIVIVPLAVISVVALVVMYRSKVQELFRGYMPVQLSSAGPGWWHKVKFHLPFLNGHISDERLGIYYRLDNQERNQILEENDYSGDEGSDIVDE